MVEELGAGPAATKHEDGGLVLEIAVFNIQSALLASKAGADRLELCENPVDGGTTPSFGTLKTIREKIVGKEHPNYASSCNNLSSLYKDMGQYEKAEQFCIEAKNIREKIFGKLHPDYAATPTPAVRPRT